MRRWVLRQSSAVHLIFYTCKVHGLWDDLQMGYSPAAIAFQILVDCCNALRLHFPYLPESVGDNPAVRIR